MPESYPDCPIKEHRQHADSRVRRAGLHGRNETYQRWECVPGNGDDTHYFAPTLPQQRVGGRDGWCPECLRPWDVGEGVPIAKGHSYTIRDMAAGLVRLAEGQSYRQAAAYVRRRAGKPASRDGRLVRDWVAQYAPVLREQHLPDEWPELIVVDHTTFRRRARDEDGNLIPGGEPAFHVMGALSYGGGTLDEAQRPRKRGRLWLLRADTESNEAAWHRFFDQLDGQPKQVVCDRDNATWAALRNRWSDTEIFPCTWHLYQNLKGYVSPELAEWLGDDYVNESTFTNLDDYGKMLDRVEALKQTSASFFAEDGKSRDEHPQALLELDSWLERTEPDIVRALQTPHQPLTTGALESPLRERVQGALYDRKDRLDNLDRLNDLLVLLQIQQMEEAHEHRWGALLMQHLKERQGEPEVQRQAVDGSYNRIIPNSPYA